MHKVKRLTPAKVTMLMFIVIGGLIVAYIAKGLLATEAAPAQVATRNIPMALADIRPGTLLTEAHVGLGSISVADLKPAMLLDARGLVGRVVKEPISAANPILSSQLYLPGEWPPLEVGDNMRAVSVQMGEGTGIVNGLIKPNDFVDVHWTPSSNSDERFRGGLTMTLFRGVRILTVNQNFAAGSLDTYNNSVTLELSPEQANIMILAKGHGNINLTYNPQGRGKGVVELSNEDRATMEEILGLEPLPKATPPFVMETYRGPSRDVLQFRDGKRINPAADAPSATSSDAPATNNAPPLPTTPDVSPTA
jgi:pilus assembly protein CpaB